MKLENCDMCGTKIENGECSCGIWKEADEMKDHPVKKAMEYFHEMKRFSMTTDAPHLGCAAIFFRGDYLDCKRVEDFICKMKGRPHYKE